MNREFLKEAIADAKTMKESAIANAKVALEEAFSPQLHAMFASKIEEMEVEEEEEEKVEIKEMDDIEDDEDMDLDEILAELENDLDNSTVKETLKEEESDEDAEEEGYLDGEEDEEVDIDEEDEDIDLEDMSEDDLKVFIEDVISDMVTAGELEAGEEMEVEDEDEVEVEDDMDIEVEDEEVITIDEDARTDAEEEGYKDGEADEKEDLKKDLEEAIRTVSTLKSELNEINLLNAKLLYVNKIFKAKNLNESQKTKVLGAFDKASTVSEVKIVFNTISENYTFKKKTIKEGITGSASKATFVPKEVKKPIMESDEMVKRFKKLAGII
jgi:hypothetical protein